MRRNVWVMAVLVAVGFAAVGCEMFYRRPNVEAKFAKVTPGMDKQAVIGILGKPTGTIQNELWYIYDDPTKPVRLRFVLNENGAVAEKYYETKASLAEKVKAGEAAAVTEPLPGEEQRTYPGGPLPQFEKK